MRFWPAALMCCAALTGCADYLNHRDTITLAAGDTQRTNLMLQHADPFNPDSQNTDIESDGVRIAGVIAKYRGVQPAGAAPYDGNCPTDDSIAADGSRCGDRSAESRPGG